MGGDKLVAALHGPVDPVHDKLRGATPIDTTPLPVDRTKLLAWLRSKKGHRNPLTGAIYEGLTTRIERGDFNTEEDRS